MPRRLIVLLVGAAMMVVQPQPAPLANGSFTPTSGGIPNVPHGGTMRVVHEMTWVGNLDGSYTITSVTGTLQTYNPDGTPLYQMTLTPGVNTNAPQQDGHGGCSNPPEGAVRRGAPIALNFDPAGVVTGGYTVLLYEADKIPREGALAWDHWADCVWGGGSTSGVNNWRMIENGSEISSPVQGAINEHTNWANGNEQEAYTINWQITLRPVTLSGEISLFGQGHNRGGEKDTNNVVTAVDSNPNSEVWSHWTNNCNTLELSCGSTEYEGTTHGNTLDIPDVPHPGGQWAIWYLARCFDTPGSSCDPLAP